MDVDNIDIRKTASVDDIVSCVETPIYGEAPIKLIEFFANLPSTTFFDYLRTSSVPYFFHLFEKKIYTDEDPMNWFPEELNHFMEKIQGFINSPSQELMNNCLLEENDYFLDEEVKVHTGNHYGRLFKDFDHKSYFEEAKNLLELRIKRNNIQI